MPQDNMYTEKSATGANLRALVDLEGINSITSVANGLLGKTNLNDETKRERRIEYFYDRMLLDTIKLGNEHNVFLKYCETKSVPKGNEKYLIRRWGGLTEHTIPLAEGVPPKSDKMASESFEGTYCQYGRYMEFTDRVEFNLIDDVITHYSMELGDVAVRTQERLCREEMESNPNITYGGNKAGIYELTIGDTVGIADYRLQALKFSRRLVKPTAGGTYQVICSPEHTYDLVDDPLVDKYMKYTNTAEPYVTGQPVNLFNIRFEETMLDDFAYGYTEMSNPGEFELGDGKYALRLVVTVNGVNHYINVLTGDAQVAEGTVSDNIEADGTDKEVVDSTKLKIKRTVGEVYLRDGSYIPSKVTYDIIGALDALGKTSAGEYTIVTTIRGEDGSTQPSTLKVSELRAAISTVRQLPVHKSFMFGKEHIVKTGINGETDVKFYVKEKGSAGVLDPIDQRQSVGFKINTIGFNTVRPEAMVQFVFVPTQALATYNEVIDEYEKHYPIKDAAGKFDGGYSNTSN